ncbi:NMT1/THI5 like domain protein [Beutenbergia cavernae DSM 12333]|uniref:NMT1/THI5 like domain protein n=1 Tax=Beutenbergia cavernae (strain ATCC BAA-8 / DSM 12333 / CCUG 43141 / JCM 11478 / NBRC 16432 / NCIMB 13614 / HKI 0122) TaxID=471853 RepID=C5C6A1_BEUC1|nr:ABC transporter substrate-binding protein [Beutenbergia cavernae]ACQ80307.1 NMT1/THI5 like domain protein [Beutenbergia cavernae DSM 12333]
MTRSLTSRPLRSALGAAVVAVPLVLAACGSTAPGEEGTPSSAAPDLGALTIGLTYTPNVQFAPFYVAAENGYYDEAGLDVELRHHGPSESLFGALEAGEEDLVVAGGDEILQARSQGVEAVSVATLYQTYPVALLVADDAPVTGPDDLAGAVVGTPGPYGETYFGLLALLDAAGLAQDDVQVEFIGYTQQAALTTGAVDGVMGYVNNDAVQLERSGVAIRTIPLGDVPLVGIGLGARDDVVAERPDAVRAFLDATLRGLADVVADPEAAVELSAEHIPGMTASAQEDALATLEATIPLYGDASGRADLETWTAMVEFMASRDLLEGEVDVADAVTNDLLP